MQSLTLRSLYPEDIQQVAKIESSLTGSPRRAFLEKRLAMATANPIEAYLDEVADMPKVPQSMPDRFITCAVLDGKNLAGYGFARILEGEFGNRSAVVDLDDIGVASDYQGRGIGKMVIAGIEQRMKSKNIGILQTQVEWSNLTMIRFFSTNGFMLGSGQIIERPTTQLGKEDSARSETPLMKRVVVRPLKWEDLASVDRIDAKRTGLDRSAYCAAKFREELDESGVCASLVAEVDGAVVGFIMARVDSGEFGRVDSAAVIDTIGVLPDFDGSGIGHELLTQLFSNLAAMQVKTVRTKVEHEDSGLWTFLLRRGFKSSQRLLLTKNIQ